MKRIGTVAMVGVVMLGLAGCSGSGSTDPSEVSPTSSSVKPTLPTTGETAAEGKKECDKDTAPDRLEISYGDLTAASDEWSAELGLTWRHYYPLTIKNIGDETCVFGVGTTAVFDKHPAQFYDLYVPLKPGQSYTAQMFELERGIEFTTDSESATPTVPVELNHSDGNSRRADPNYYDHEITFGEIQGSGADAILPMTIKIIGVAEGEPKRASSSNEDFITILGLDAKGDAVAAMFYKIDPVIEAGETRQIDLPVAGGGSSPGDKYNFNSLSDYKKAVSFEVVDYAPSATHRREG